MKKHLFFFLLLCLPMMIRAQQQFEINGVFTAVLTGATHPPVEKSLDQLHYTVLPSPSGFLYIVLDQEAPEGTYYDWAVVTGDGSQARFDGPTNGSYTCLTLSGTETTYTLRIFLRSYTGDIYSNILANRDIVFHTRYIPSVLSVYE